MRKTLDLLYSGCGILAALSMLGIVILIAMQIIARLFLTNIPSSDDISRYMVAWTTFTGLSYAMKHGDHIRVDLFLKAAPLKVRHYFEIAVSFLGFVLMSMFLFYVFLLVKESYEFGDFTSGQMAIPLWWVQTPYLFGVFALTVAILDRFFSLLFSSDKSS